MAVLLLDTGLRVGEALNLRKDDVHIDPAGSARYGWVHVREGKSKNAKRNVPMTGRVSAAVKPLLTANTSQWLFPGDSPERPILATSLAHIHTRVCRPLVPIGRKLVRKQAFPKEFVIHSARHTCLTRLGEAGVDAFTIMKLAGHSALLRVNVMFIQHPRQSSVLSIVWKR